VVVSSHNFGRGGRGRGGWGTLHFKYFCVIIGVAIFKNKYTYIIKRQVEYCKG
jgi:hypothetical protein